jgi:hypothetical protein
MALQKKQGIRQDIITTKAHVLFIKKITTTIIIVEG